MFPAQKIGRSIPDPDRVLGIEPCSPGGELETRRIDLLILGVRVGPYDQDPPDDGSTEGVENLAEEEGIRIIAAVRERRFVPLAFYTGLNYNVRAMESPVAVRLP